MVEEGELIHVFDFATKGSRCQHLRFYVPELTHPETVRHLPLKEVINRIVGTGRERLRLSECLSLLMFSWQHAATLIQSGELKARRENYSGPSGHVTWLPTEELKIFLAARWLGTCQSNPAPTAPTLRSPTTPVNLRPSRRFCAVGTR
jgi:hypothetical protein